MKSDYADAWNSLGSASYKAQQFDQAIAAYRKALDLKPNAESHNNLGTVYFRTKSYPEAAESFKSAVGMNPNYAEAHYNLALTYVALNNRNGALAEYNILKTLDPARAEEFFIKYLKRR